MTEQRQDEACCEIVPGYERACVAVNEHYAHIANPFMPEPLFTRDDNMARLMRDELAKQGKQYHYQRELFKLVDTFGSWGSDKAMWDMMQATPAQQVEAALRAFGKWEES